MEKHPVRAEYVWNGIELESPWSGVVGTPGQTRAGAAPEGRLVGGCVTAESEKQAREIIKGIHQPREVRVTKIVLGSIQEAS